MASTYTTNLGIEKIGTGEQSGTWGDTTNTNFDILDEAINGIISVTLSSAGSSGSPTALPITDGASSNGRNKFIEFVDGGGLGGTGYVQLTPNNAEKVVHIRNSLSSSRSVIVFQGTYNASNDFEIVNGADVLLKFDGGGSGATVTDVNVDLTVTGATIATADINGGTIDGAVIGGASAAAGTFTTFTSTGIDDNATSTAITIDSSENVGIGTTSPSTILDVREESTGGSAQIRLYNTDNSNTTTQTASLFLSPDSRGNGALFFAEKENADFSTSASRDVALVFSPVLNNSQTEAMRIDSSGNVGIGSASNHAGARVVINDTPPTAFGSPMFQVGQETFTSSGIYSIGFGFTNGTYTEPPAEIAAVSTSSSGGTTADIIFGTRSVTTNTAVTERMRIDSSGNVGIGATSPSYPLDVVGPIRIKHAGSDSFATIRGPVNRDLRIDIDANGDTDSFVVRDLRDDSERFLVQAGGNVGIGTTSPSSLLEIEGDGSFDSTQGLRIQGSSGANIHGIYGDLTDLIFATALSEAMRIDSSGNVGIGTTSLSTPLTVSRGAAENGLVARLYAYEGGITDRGLEISTDASGGRVNSEITYNAESGAATGQHVWQTDGTERMRIDSSGNVGIGTDSPDALLNLEANQNPVLRLGSSDGTVQVGNILGTVEFYSNDTNAPGVGAKIYAEQEDQIGAAEAGIVFETGVTGALAERMRINSDGLIGIGTASPANKLTVASEGKIQAFNSANDRSILVYNDNNAATVQSDVDPLKLQSATSVRFNSGGANERMRILSTGGITFNGDTATANALDDYEEGTWTPVSNSGTIGTTSAQYTKIGRQVFVSARMLDFSDYTSTTNIEISGLPYTSAASTNVVGAVMYRNVNDSSIADLTVYMGSSDSHFYLYLSKNNGGLWESLTYASFDSGLGDVYVSFSYIV